MRILFLGDTSHPNSIHWIEGLKATGKCEIITWDLPLPTGSFGKFKRIWNWLTALISIKKLIKKTRPDLLIAYRITSYGFIGYMSRFKPFVLAAQGESDVRKTSFWSTPFKKKLAQLSISKADMIHAWGEHMAENMRKFGAKENQLLIRPKGIDFNRFNLTEKNKNYEKLEIVVTRSLKPLYRHKVILNAAKKLKQKQINFHLHIAGSGILEEDLKAKSIELGLQNDITFHGKVDIEHLPKLLNSCNIYVSMPYTEGISASLLEAMACGLIPVVSDVEGNRLLIENEKNGFLVKVDAAEALANTLIRVQKNESNKNIISTNYEFVKSKASLEANMKYFVERYQQLINMYKN